MAQSFLAALVATFVSLFGFSVTEPHPSLAATEPATSGPQQETPVSPPRGILPEKDETQADALLASDGKEAQAGRIPAGVPEKAAAAWTAFRKAIGGTAPAPQNGVKAARSFELNLAIRYKENGQSNDFDAQVAYLEIDPGLLKLTILDRDDPVSTQMRGFKGKSPAYWLRKDRGEGQTDGWVRLAGSDYASDRAEIERYASACFNLARLTDPASVRLVDLGVLVRGGDGDLEKGLLKLGDDAGVRLPNVDVLGVIDGPKKKLRELCAALEWITVETPDFRLFPISGLSDAEQKMLQGQTKRVVMGVDPKDHLPRIMFVSPNRRAHLQEPGTLLIQCTEWFKDEDAGPGAPLLPGRFYVYEVERSRSGDVRYSDKTTADLYFRNGNRMNAGLSKEDFAPKQ